MNDFKILPVYTKFYNSFPKFCNSGSFLITSFVEINNRHSTETNGIVEAENRNRLTLLTNYKTNSMDYTVFGSSFLCWAFIAFAIALIMFMPSGKKRVSVNDVLQEKFADGTLSVAEYEERKSILAKEAESNKKKSSWF